MLDTGMKFYAVPFRLTWVEVKLTKLEKKLWFKFLEAKGESG